jgi:CheY-like chemotaxis protein/glycine cleavage system H lipoate-binding protein
MTKRILVVDDEAVVLGAVSKALNRTDCVVETARSADEALRLIGGACFDVVITDLMMPGIDGLQLMQRLRDLGSPAQTIMITGYPTIQTALRAKRMGAFEYVTKPFTRQELISAVVRALRQGSDSTGAAEAPGAHDQAGCLYCIPGHCWARIEVDRTARIGMARGFAAATGEVTGLEIPTPGDALEQGRMCVTVRAGDGVEHYLHSPLTGRVLELNRSVVQDPGLAARDPEGEGWILRLAPYDLDRELQNLSPC